MNHIGYLSTTSDNKFVWDIKLGINLHNYNTWYKWRSFVDNISDRYTKEWYDYEIDISDLPPSIFFLGVVNTYSVAFSLYIPLDQHIVNFSANTAEDMRFFLGTGEQVDSCAAVVYIDRANLDIEYLHKTGKIKSTRDWNRNMSRNIYVYEDFTATGTIQGIVKD